MGFKEFIKRKKLEREQEHKAQKQQAKSHPKRRTQRTSNSYGVGQMKRASAYDSAISRFASGSDQSMQPAPPPKRKKRKKKSQYGKDISFGDSHMPSFRF